MIEISVKEALREFESAKQQLGERQFNKAVSRSINESILKGRTEARKAVKAIYNIPQRYLGGININRSNSLSLTASLFASATPIPMDAFSPKYETASMGLSISKKGVQKQKSYKRSRKNPVAGVSIEVIRGNREIIPFAFLLAAAQSRVFARGEYKGGGSYGFIQRHTRLANDSGNDSVKPLLSVTVHAAVINKTSLDKISAEVNNTFPKSIERNVGLLIAEIKGAKGM